MNSEPNRKKGGERLLQQAKPQKPRRTKGTQKPKVVRSPKEQALHVLFIVTMVVAALIVVLGLVYLILVRKPATPDLPGRPNQSQEGLVPGETPRPPASSDRKDNFWTFLVVGRDTYGGGNTDTILLAAYDIPNQKLNVMSLPRDTLVNVSWDIKKINSVYNMNHGGDEGITALKDEVSQLVGFVPDFQVIVEWKAVGELVDAIDGVDFEVPRRMYYNDLSQHFKIDLQPGYQNLNGDEAMGLIRWRHNSDDSGNILNSGYADGDLGRIKTQQAFLTAALKQCLQFKNVTKIGELAKVFNDNVTTNLTLNNIAWFGQMAVMGNGGSGALDMENVNFVTMPWVSAAGVWSRTYGNNPSYVAPDVDKLLALVNESFNPYVEDLRKSELDIMYVNKDGTLGCTGGDLADQKYNAWIKNKPASTPKPSKEPTETPVESMEPMEPMEPEEPGTSPDPSQQPGTSAKPTASPSPTPGLEQPEATPAPTPEPTPTPTPPPATGPSDGIVFP
ncbi:MAG: LCP family protein [Pseudoflavonifractor sp.]